jgi:uncharacterized protein DUF6881
MHLLAEALSMKYIRVGWHHSSPEEPIVLYSEIDEEGWERRKVYIFRDGPPGYASAMEETRSVFLGIEPVPPISEIASDPQFEPREITQQEFEEVWAEAHSGASSPGSRSP